MKKIISLVLIMTLNCTMCYSSVFAQINAAWGNSIPQEYAEYVSEAIDNSEFSEEQIDIDNIFVVENTSHINLKKDFDPIMFWIALPMIDSTDISYSGFEKGNFVKAFTNFVALDGMVSPYDGMLDKYISDNNLSKPAVIKNMWISERVHVFAYSVICDDTEYIIPYYFTDESTFNKMEDESCVMDLGRAYPVDDFISLCEKESELYTKYLAEQRANDSKSVVYIDKDGEESIKGNNDTAKTNEKDSPPKNDTSKKDSDKEALDKPEIQNSDDQKDEEIYADLSFEDKIGNLIELGIVEGDPNGNLRLNENITRAEFAKVVCKVLNADSAPTSVSRYFSDVDANFWAFGYIETARRYGIVNGYGDDPYYPTFRPYNNITYEESFKMIVEMLGYGYFADKSGGYPEGYKDVALQELELFNAFVSDYSAYITRGELFEIVYNALDVPIAEVYDRKNGNFKIMNGTHDAPLNTLRSALEK